VECREGIKYNIHNNIITDLLLRRDRGKRHENRYNIIIIGIDYRWLGYLMHYNVKRIRFRRACDDRHVCVTH